MAGFFIMEPYPKGQGIGNFLKQNPFSVDAKIATEAGQTPLDSHSSRLFPNSICPGSNQLPRKTLLSNNEILGNCEKCSAIFTFDSYSMQWIKLTDMEG